MNNTKTTAVSGCVIWFLLICMISSCVMPVFFVASMFSLTSDFAIQMTGGWLCPDGTSPSIRSFATYGSGPSTTSVLECVDASKNVVKEDPVGFAFLWIGILAVIGLILSGVLAFVFAVPGGMLVTRILNRLKSPRARKNLIN